MICGCGEPAASVSKGSLVCERCKAIETGLQRRTDLKTREELLQAQARYNETRTDAWLFKSQPPPAAPVEAVLSVGGYALYWWNKLGQMHRAI